MFPLWSVNGREQAVVARSRGKTHVSVFLCLRLNSNTESQSEAGKDEGVRRKERAGYKGQKMRARLRSENQSDHLSLHIFRIDALWYELPADSPRFLGCSGIQQKEREKYQQL